MKKLIYLLILIPVTSFAKFHQGIMTFRDNTTKNGFIEIPDDSENNKIKFRLEEKGSTEKYPLEEIKSFIVYNDKKQEIKFAITHLAYFNAFSKDNSFRAHNKWACVRVIKEGKINLYSAWFMTAGAGGGAIGGGTITGSFTTSGDLYINREGQNYSLEFYEADSSGFSITVNSWKYFLTVVEKHLTQTELGDLVDKKREYISRIENNGSNLTLKTLYDIVEKGLGGKVKIQLEI